MEFLHILGHPETGERRLKDLNDGGQPADLVSDGREDRCMENDILAKGCYGGLKITGLQCGREGSLARTHGGGCERAENVPPLNKFSSVERSFLSSKS